MTTGKPIIVYNEDSDNMMNRRWHADPEHYTEQEIRDYIASVIAGGQVTHFFFCVDARTSAYPSKVFDNYWDCLDDPEVEPDQRIRPMKDLIVTQGVDQFAIGLGMCRAKGVSPWLSFRMNDIHFVDNPKFWINIGHWKRHPELWIDPSSATNGCRGWWQRAYDYRKEEVQARMLAYIEEALGRYDPDGIELDWMRFEHHVPRETARGEGAEALNAFMRRARALVNAAAEHRGHPIQIAARVDSDPVSALNHGTDYRVWAKEGLMDWLIPCNFFSTVDFELPFAKWAEEVSRLNPDVLVLPGLDCGVLPDGKWPRRFLTADEYAAWGDRMYSQGAQGAYFFNLFCEPVDKPDLEKYESWDLILHEGFTPENLARHPKSIPPNAPRECVMGGWC